MTDVKAFFREIRQSVFRGRMSQSQVDGCKVLLRVWSRHYGDQPANWLAYCLATAFHETAHTMQPVREGLCKTDTGSIKAVTGLFRRGRIKRNYALPDEDTGHSYFGRGYVQLTHKDNYEKAGSRLKVDLVNNPSLALNHETSARILFSGMIEGWFTGRALKRNINEKRCSYVAARGCVNGSDKAKLIAGYADAFEAALRAQKVPIQVPLRLNTKIVPEDVTGKKMHRSTTNGAAVAGAAAGVAAGGQAAVQSSPWAAVLAGGLMFAAIAAAAWIIYQRKQRAQVDGV